MPATSSITFINDRHSFTMEKHADKRDASNRIPRPPNAFILYRSDFLQRRAVPPEVEKRQQNLSRIAGQCWNMLPDTEKVVWYNKAAVIRAEHRARYPSHKPGPFHEDTNGPPVEDKRRARAAGGPLSSIRQSRPRKTRPYQSPYCEGMFAALYDSNISTPVSQIRPLSPTSALESPLSTSATLSPLSSPHLLSPSPLRVHSDCNDLPSDCVTYQNPMISRNKTSCVLQPSDSAAMRRDLVTNKSKDVEIPCQASSEIGPPAEPYRTLRPSTLATCVLPQPRLEQLPTLCGNPFPPISLTPLRSDTFSPAGHPVANDFGATDDLTHFEQSSLYTSWYITDKPIL